MKKVKFSFEQFNEFEKQQRIRDLTEKIIRELVFLSSICSRKDEKEVLECVNNLKILRNETVKKLDEMIDWE